MSKSQKREAKLADNKVRAKEFPREEIKSILDENGFYLVREKARGKSSHFFYRHDLLQKYYPVLKHDPVWQKKITPGGEIQIVFHGKKAYGPEAKKIHEVLELLKEIQQMEEIRENEE